MCNRYRVSTGLFLVWLQQGWHGLGAASHFSQWGRVVTPVPPGGGIGHEPLGFKPCSPLAGLFSLSCTSQQPKCCSRVLAHHGTPRHATAAGTLPTRPVRTARPRGPPAPQQQASPGSMLLHAEPQSLPAAPVLLASAQSWEQAGRAAAGLPASWALVGGTCAPFTDV